MELRTIGYFVAVADAGSVSAATQITHVTQPLLSHASCGSWRRNSASSCSPAVTDASCSPRRAPVTGRAGVAGAGRGDPRGRRANQGRGLPTLTVAAPRSR